MITMRQRAGAACFAVALLLSGLTGCRAAETWNGSGADRTEAETAKENQDENSEETEEAGTKAEQSRGMIFGDQIQELLPQQTQLITDYMETYYSGLASLTPQDMSAFFAEEAEDQLLLNECALEYAVGLRSMQQSDLTLAEPWWIFPKGTEREKIWRYFDIHYHYGVAALLFPKTIGGKMYENSIL